MLLKNEQQILFKKPSKTWSPSLKNILRQGSPAAYRGHDQSHNKNQIVIRENEKHRQKTAANRLAFLLEYWVRQGGRIA
jgi:hypothetical protein